MTPNTEPRDHTLTLRGIRFHYVEWGDAAGRPLVLLHGITGHARTWDHLAASLGPWSIRMDGTGSTLTATVRDHEPQRVTQRPLVFEVPRPGKPWRWTVDTLQIDGSTCTAQLGPSEE